MQGCTIYFVCSSMHFYVHHVCMYNRYIYVTMQTKQKIGKKAKFKKYNSYFSILGRIG